MGLGIGGGEECVNLRAFLGNWDKKSVEEVSLHILVIWNLHYNNKIFGCVRGGWWWWWWWWVSLIHIPPTHFQSHSSNCIYMNVSKAWMYVCMYVCLYVWLLLPPHRSSICFIHFYFILFFYFGCKSHSCFSSCLQCGLAIYI